MEGEGGGGRGGWRERGWRERGVEGEGGGGGVLFLVATNLDCLHQDKKLFFFSHFLKRVLWVVTRLKKTPNRSSVTHD